MFQDIGDNDSYVYKRAADGGVNDVIRRELTPVEMEAAETRMENRRKYLERECNNLPRGISSPNAWEYLINRQYHLIW